jgi:hypothetical protein
VASTPPTAYADHARRNSQAYPFIQFTLNELPLQELAIDLLYHLPAASEQLLRATALVCLGDAYPAPAAARLLDVLAAKAAAGGADPGAFCGLLLNVLSGHSVAGLLQRSWQRHEALVGAGCAAALQLGDPAAAAAALLPPLAAAADAQGDSGERRGCWAAYGLLRLVAALLEAAAARQQPLQLPAQVAAALPHLLLSFLAGGPQAAAGGGGTLDGQAATALCLRLLCLQPGALLPPLLEALPASLAPQQPSGEAAEPRQPAAPALSAALQLLQALLQEQRLRAALLEQQAAVRAALAACQAAAEAAGGHEAREQVTRLLALTGTVLGS